MSIHFICFGRPEEEKYSWKKLNKKCLFALFVRQINVNIYLLKGGLFYFYLGASGHYLNYL